MNDERIATHLENLDRRLTRVEQILPTLPNRTEVGDMIAKAVEPLATRAEMEAAIATAIATAVAPLATKAEMHAAIATAVAPLATKADLDAGLEESRRHTTILIERQQDDIRLLAEHVSALMTRVEEGFR